MFMLLHALEPGIYGQQQDSTGCSMADTLNNIGANYYIEGDWELAKSTFLQAINYARNCTPEDSNRLIPVLLNLGGIYSQTWQYDKALALFQRAERIYENAAVKDLEYLSFMYIYIGRTYSAIGDYSKAEEYYQNALLLFQEIKAYSDINKNAVITLYNGLGVLSKRMKKYPQAIEQYNKAIEFSIKQDPSQLAFIYGNIANAYREMKEYNISENYFLKAIAEKEIVRKQDSVELAIMLTDYSGLLLDEKKLDQAKDIIEQAHQLCYLIWGSRNPQLAEIQINMGKYYELSGNYDKAIYWYQKSLLSLYSGNDIFMPGSESLPASIISKQHLLISLKAIGKVYQMKYVVTDSLLWLKKSLKIYEQSIMLADIIRHGYISNDSRLFLAENEKATLNTAIHVAYDLYNQTREAEYLDKAFEFSERSKAALLLSSIQSNTAITFSGIPKKLGDREKDLLREISVTEVTIYEEEQKASPNAQKLLKWKNSLLRLKSDHESLIDTLEQNYPRYYQLKYRNNLVARKELISRLKNDYNLLEYNMEDTSVFIFVVNRKGIHCMEMPVNDQFYTALTGILKQLQHFDPTRHSSDHFRKFCSYSYALYQILIKPIEPYLISDKIILVPDEILSYLPFDILVTRLTGDQAENYRDLPYLIKKYTLSYSYSASLLTDDNIRGHERNNRKVLAVAPVYSYEKAGGSLPAVRQYYLEHLSPLPGAAEEVALITKLLKGRKLTDSMATEKAFKKFAPEFGILHLAMHALIDNQNPMYSKLVFNQWLRGPDEGLLNTYELYDLQLNARMVVLSACRSGDGILQKGEGIMSLARGFLYAGCPSLVMTLWNVEDKSGLEIMHHFYHQIKKGKTKNEALRQSKLHYLESAAPHKTHPYYWAGYLQIGEPSAIFINGWGKVLLIIIVPSMIVALAAVYRKRMKKRRLSQNPREPRDRTLSF